MTYRLRYVPGAHNDHFRSIRYPRPSLPGYATRERAEQVREAMPDPSSFEIEESD